MTLSEFLEGDVFEADFHGRTGVDLKPKMAGEGAFG
ncbi:MAG: hypothetical protein RLZZ244_1135, partial [Verrucomicrobiota bacterium]